VKESSIGQVHRYSYDRLVRIVSGWTISLHLVRATYPEDEEIHEAIVDLAMLEHPLRSNRTPNDRGVVDYFGTGACEALRVMRVAEVFDVAEHPAQYYWKSISEYSERFKQQSGVHTPRLYRGSQDRRVNLGKEQWAGWDFLLGWLVRSLSP
jgi:hypothetical protein